MRTTWCLLPVVALLGLPWILASGTQSHPGQPLVETPLPPASQPASQVAGQTPPVPWVPPAREAVAALPGGEAAIAPVPAELQPPEQACRDEGIAAGLAAAEELYEVELLVLHYISGPDPEARHEADDLIGQVRRSLVTPPNRRGEAALTGRADASEAGLQPVSGSAWQNLLHRLPELERGRALRVMIHARLLASDARPVRVETGSAAVGAAAGDKHGCAAHGPHLEWNVLVSARPRQRLRLESSGRVEDLGGPEAARPSSGHWPAQRRGIAFGTQVEIPIEQPLVVGEMRSTANFQLAADPKQGRSSQDSAPQACAAARHDVTVALLHARRLEPFVPDAPAPWPAWRPLGLPQEAEEAVVLPANADAIGPLVPILPRW